MRRVFKEGEVGQRGDAATRDAVKVKVFQDSFLCWSFLNGFAVICYGGSKEVRKKSFWSEETLQISGSSMWTLPELQLHSENWRWRNAASAPSSADCLRKSLVCLVSTSAANWTLIIQKSGFTVHLQKSAVSQRSSAFTSSAPNTTKHNCLL